MKSPSHNSWGVTIYSKSKDAFVGSEGRLLEFPISNIHIFKGIELDNMLNFNSFDVFDCRISELDMNILIKLSIEFTSAYFFFVLFLKKFLFGYLQARFIGNTLLKKLSYTSLSGVEKKVFFKVCRITRRRIMSRL